ncbi:hypothetical protein BCR36DRAFT_582825, partial [Piromyces finnis]
MFNKKLIKQIILLSTLNIIQYTKAESQCSSNLDCAKYNTEVDTHVCIRFNGQTDYVCYLSTEAYCDSDKTCQAYNEKLKFCYVPPWITNKNSQKQCFTVHQAGATCVEDIHCEEGLVCSDNVCVKDIGNTRVVGSKGNSTETTTSKTTSKNKASSKSTNSSTNTIGLDDDDEEKKKGPIEIIGLPLWAFILLTAVPVIFIIAILWGLSIGRRSYREEEERKKGRLAIENNKRDLETNYKGSNESLLPKSSSEINMKDELLKNYVNAEGKKKGNEFVSSSISSNSTIGNNLTAVTVDSKGKTSPFLDVPKTRKPRKSNASTNSDVNIPPKPKKPKSIVNSEYSDSNSFKGLLSSGQPMGMSAAESGIYSSYFGGAGGSTVSASYFGGQPMNTIPPTDPAMTALYYQQYMAAQAQQAAAAQQYMNQYYVNNGMGMASVDMMQYQQMYNMGMGMAYPGSDVSSTVETK